MFVEDWNPRRRGLGDYLCEILRSLVDYLVITYVILWGLPGDDFSDDLVDYLLITMFIIVLAM